MQIFSPDQWPQTISSENSHSNFIAHDNLNLMILKIQKYKTNVIQTFGPMHVLVRTGIKEYFHPSKVQKVKKSYDFGVPFVKNVKQ